MADTQITILGMSGAGKTCFLLGLYYKMGSGMKGYTIATDDDTDVQLRDRYKRLSDTTLEKENRFPAGTDNITKYEFDLQYGYKTIMSFDWVDYPGGLLDRKNSGDLEEYENIKKSINNSSTLFICVDGSLLMGSDTEEKTDYVRDNCSNVMNTFFSEYLKSNNTLPPTAIIITKYDMCKKDTDENELREIIEEAFSPLFIKDDKEKIVTIIPVSLGRDIMDEDSSKIRPLNLHLPIFMGIYFSLMKKIENYVQEIEKIIKDNNQVILNKQIRKAELDKKIIFKNKSEIESFARQIRDLEQKSEKERNEMNNLLNAMESNSDKLIKELNKIPYVYINGEISSFSDITK